jgi:hypothetical protein
MVKREINSEVQHSTGAHAPLERQARQESNLQPPVLETGALPIELRT